LKHSSLIPAHAGIRGPELGLRFRLCESFGELGPDPTQPCAEAVRADGDSFALLHTRLLA
jgi:hypothetical protein